MVHVEHVLVRSRSAVRSRSLARVFVLFIFMVLYLVVCLLNDRWKTVCYPPQYASPHCFVCVCVLFVSVSRCHLQPWFA